MLIDAITKAFNQVPYPGDDLIVYDNSGCHLECNEIAKSFKGKHWKHLDCPFIVRHHSALSAFTPEAFHFFLPAYLIISIEHYADADVVPGSLLFAFNASKSETFLSRSTRLTPAQKHVIRQFIEFIRDQHGEDFPSGAPQDALKSYWSEC